MSTVGGRPPGVPDGNNGEAPRGRVDRGTGARRVRVTLHDGRGGAARPLRPLAARPETGCPTARPSGGRHRLPDPAGCLIGRVLDSWGITVRLALLLLVIFGGFASVIVAALGYGGGVLLGGLLTSVVVGTRRRRVPATAL
jgi:hypothetical protein